MAVRVQAAISARKDCGHILFSLARDALVGHQRLPRIVDPQAAAGVLVYTRDGAIQQADQQHAAPFHHISAQ